MFYEPLVHTVKKTADLNESTARTYSLFVNSKKSAPMPDNGLYLYADSRVSVPGHFELSLAEIWN